MSRLLKGSKSLWWWMLAFAPALVLLILIIDLIIPVPYLDSWTYVGQYQEWMEGHLGWRKFFTRHYDHPAAVGKAIYFAVLHGLRGQVGVLPLLGWSLSMVIAAGVCRLAHPLWAENGRRGAALMFLANLIIFNAAQGSAWVWDFLFQNFIPGACLVVGMVVLSGERPRRWRLATAGVLSVIATFSFASGFLAGVLLAPWIWKARADKSLARRSLITLAWLAFVSFVAWVALSQPRIGIEREAVSLEMLRDHPLMRLRGLLILLGQMLGKGTVFKPENLCAMLGGTLMLAFLACSALVFRHRRDRELVCAALPWITCCLYGLANAALICMGRTQRSLTPVLSERYITFTLFFALGAMFLVATVVRLRDDIAVNWLRKAAAPVSVLFIAALAINWKLGWQSMDLTHTRMAQERAMLAFMNVVPPGPEWVVSRQTRRTTLKLAKFLSANGQLPGVKPVADSRIEAFTRIEKAPEQWARFDTPERQSDGRWVLSGVGGLSDSTPTHLILVTAQGAGETEQIIALAAPLLPDTFWERQAQRRKYPEHFLRWSETIDPASLPTGPVTLRAYALIYGRQAVLPINGIHTIQAAETTTPRSVRFSRQARCLDALRSRRRPCASFWSAPAHWRFGNPHPANANGHAPSLELHGPPKCMVHRARILDAPLSRHDLTASNFHTFVTICSPPPFCCGG